MKLPVVGAAVDALFDGWERAWSGRDPAAFDALCTPDVHYEDPLTPEPLRGPAAIAGHAARLWHSFPDARLQRTGERLAGGTFAAAPMKLVATHREALEGLPATGRFVVVQAVVYAELQDGRLHRVRAFFDLYAAAVELGVLPRPGGIGERALFMLRGFGLGMPRTARPTPPPRGSS
jgi:steroid delta-isomerase-like uncharacterized protein